MEKLTRTTIDLAENLRDRVRRLVLGCGLNRFVNEAVAEKVNSLESERVAREMREGYIATRDERLSLAV